MKVTWVGLPPALLKSLFCHGRQPWGFLGFYSSTGRGRGFCEGAGLVAGGGASWGRDLSRDGLGLLRRAV